MKKILIAAFIFLSTSACADVYRWVDSAGKTHYSDNKSATSAQNITHEVKVTNIDTSAAEQQKMEKLFRKENDADRAYFQQKSQTAPQKSRECFEAENYLRKLNHAVTFLDEQGNALNISEAERKRRAEEFSKQYHEHCE